MDYRLYILECALAGDLSALQPIVLTNYLQRLVADGHLVVEPPVEALDKGQIVREGPFATREVTVAKVTDKGRVLLGQIKPAVPAVPGAPPKHPWFG
jgi:hypothetical protein